MTQIRELEPVLCHEGRTSQLIWTSSSNAHRSAFNIEEMQHQRGTQPYSSSKYATDLLSLALNTRYNKQVSSHTLFSFSFTSHDDCDPAFISCFPGVVLICHLSWFCDDQSDLWHPALLSSLPLDSAYACLLACECTCDVNDV